jgi:C4-dicarboxylate-specific signal transduction histidine kinase
VPPHVLFVDDDESNLVVWKAAFSDEFDVLVASSAAEGLELMRRHTVGIVLADQRMPGMTGTEMLARAREESPHAIRMLITGYSDLGAAIDAINRGNVRRYLRKPCPIPELAMEIREALDLYELRRRVHSMERRLVATERVYALGLVASGIGRELERPARWIRESVTLARTEIQELTDRLGRQGVDSDILKVRLGELQGALARALEGVERVSEIAASVAPPRQGAESRTELLEVIRMALRIVRGETRNRADIELDLAPVPLVVGSATQLGQIVLNLLVSAIEGVSERPVAERLVTLRVRPEGRTVHLELTDTGPPIADEDLRHLFDPFHATRRPRGTGLGLAISRAIAEELGGSIDVANRPGGGVFFRLVVPAAQGLAGSGS